MLDTNLVHKIKELSFKDQKQENMLKIKDKIEELSE